MTLDPVSILMESPGASNASLWVDVYNNHGGNAPNRGDFIARIGGAWNDKLKPGPQWKACIVGHDGEIERMWHLATRDSAELNGWANDLNKRLNLARPGQPVTPGALQPRCP